MRLLGLRASHVKFGFSAVRECLQGMEVFLNPSHHAEQMPWVRDSRRRVSRELRRAIEDFRFLLEPAVETFAYSGIESRDATFESELHALRSNEAQYVDAVVKRLSGGRLFGAAHMERIREPRWYRRAAAEYLHSHPHASKCLNGFLNSPSRSLHAFCEVLALFHEQAIAHWWGSISQRLQVDVAMRRRIMKERGLAATLRTLSPSVTIHSGRQGITVDVLGRDTEIAFADTSSVLLVPSFFSWPHTQAVFLKGPPAPRCIMTYALPPLSVRTRRLNDRRSLVTVLQALADPMRLRMAELLRERDLSTRELAGFLNQSDPVVSRHLRQLLQCGLLDQQRSGYFMMYRLRKAAVKQLASDLSALT